MRATGILLLLVSLPALANEVPTQWPSSPTKRDALPDAPSKWRIGGYVQNQTGVFFSSDQVGLDSDGFPTSHGDKLGELSMCRTTFQLETDLRINKQLSAHAIVRAAFSPELKVDEEAQVPVDGYRFNPGARPGWVRDNYYNEVDVRELYLDWSTIENWRMRIGRQLVSWGESGLLDVINPVDGSWHFASFESFEDVRIPLWMVRQTVDIPAMDGGFDLVWVPMVPGIERPEDVVTVPLTSVGAWGLPLAPIQNDESLSPAKYRSKTFEYPHRFLEDSRLGARLKGAIGHYVNYSLMYYWTHQITPPIPRRAVFPAGIDGIDVYLDFPRQHVAGLSLEANAPFPAATMLKFEALVEPNRTFPLFSTAQSFDEEHVEILEDGSSIRYLDAVKRTMLTYALTIQQPFFIRSANRDNPFVLVLQWTHGIVLDYDAEDQILSVPSYDSTLMTKHQYKFVAALFTTFMQGLLSPKIAGGWVSQEDDDGGVEQGGGFLTMSLNSRLGDNWNLGLAVNMFFAEDPYWGLGFYRDRDEVNLRVRYQF